MTHLIDKACSCGYCIMIDSMWGDPHLNPWEAKFVASVARFGWFADYSDKQKTCIKKIFKKQRLFRSNQRKNRRKQA